MRCWGNTVVGYSVLEISEENAARYFARLLKENLKISTNGGKLFF